MLTDLRIRNFKSIRDASIAPGQVTVLIGENGSGKSNFLEALAMAGAAVGDRLESEFLVCRGIRVAEPQYMRSAFERETDRIIRFDFVHSEERATYALSHHDTGPYVRWEKERENSEDSGAPVLRLAPNGTGELELTLFGDDGEQESVELIQRRGVRRLPEAKARAAPVWQ